MHRLVCLLGAEAAAPEITWQALTVVARRARRYVDPIDRIEALQEQLVHLSRSERGSAGQLWLPAVTEPSHQAILTGLNRLPIKLGELLVVAHYLQIFGPELAHVMRLTVRGTNYRIEEGLDQLARITGVGSGGQAPGLGWSLSEQVTAALQDSAKQIPVPSTDEMADELRTDPVPRPSGVTLRVAIAAAAAAAVVGALVGYNSGAHTAALGPEASLPVSAQPSAASSISLPVQASDVPVYYVGRGDQLLYRERRNLATEGDLLDAALNAVLQVAPRDPRYMSEWGPGQVIDAELNGDSLTVNLTAEAFEDVETNAAAARAANQMLYTAAELIGDDALRIQFLQGGAPPPTAFQRQDGFQLRGLDPMPEVWIVTPENDEQVGAGSLRIRGTVKPDAPPPIVAIKGAEGDTAYSLTPTHYSAVPTAGGWLTWSVVVELEPGSYIVTADAAGDTQDEIESKAFTVE